MIQYQYQLKIYENLPSGINPSLNNCSTTNDRCADRCAVRLRWMPCILVTAAFCPELLLRGPPTLDALYFGDRSLLLLKLLLRGPPTLDALYFGDRSLRLLSAFSASVGPSVQRPQPLRLVVQLPPPGRLSFARPSDACISSAVGSTPNERFSAIAVFSFSTSFCAASCSHSCQLLHITFCPYQLQLLVC